MKFGKDLNGHIVSSTLTDARYLLLRYPARWPCSFYLNLLTNKTTSDNMNYSVIERELQKIAPHSSLEVSEEDAGLKPVKVQSNMAHWMAFK